MVEEQRAQICARREELLHDASEPTACAEAAPEHHAALVRAAGAAEVARAENRLTMLVLDRRWSDHLRLIEDIREGIHLQRYAGRDPLTEFQRQIIDAYAAMMEELRADVVDRFGSLRAEGGRIDLERLGLRGPASTWTYLINDNPFASFWVSLIAPGNLGTSIAGAFLAVLYLPVTALAMVSEFVRRARDRRRGQPS
jgi:preprotein translocase subunit SecA